ncbi:hypothetical protein HF882_14885 [Victivallis vadensis]|uniref:Uncharacterized protein n=1 Tax=Victivallis vadensis TaxID=172901 RepID=A0A848AYA6_9BACT|nr:hypothetical protein [Victivallis vadensis]NMD87871.1 hypothetical protein [Victivallis vadensis]
MPIEPTEEKNAVHGRNDTDVTVKGNYMIRVHPESARNRPMAAQEQKHTHQTAGQPSAAHSRHTVKQGKTNIESFYLFGHIPFLVRRFS